MCCVDDLSSGVIVMRIFKSGVRLVRCSVLYRSFVKSFILLDVQAWFVWCVDAVVVMSFYVVGCFFFLLFRFLSAP